MEIKLLYLLSEQSQLSIVELNRRLQQTTLKTLNQIAGINNLHKNLIISTNGKYSLAYKLNWFDQTRINELLKQNQLGYQVHLFDQLDSTNNYAIKHIEKYNNRTIITCDWQNLGRGRFGRSWSNKIAKDLAVTIIYRFPDNFNLNMLPAVCAVAINRLLKNYSIKNQIKWPNDIYVKEDKIAGILIENVFRNSQAKTVIGIGLNNLANWNRSKLLVDLVQSLDNILHEFELFGFPLLRREWLDNCLHLNQTVIIQKEGIAINQGVHTDIGESGELIIKNDQGFSAYSSSAISLIVENYTL